MRGKVGSLKDILAFIAKEARETFLYLGLFIGFLIAIFFVLPWTGAENSFVEQMLHRQQAAVRLGSSSIESFFGFLGSGAVVLADNPRILSSNLEAELAMQNFVQRWKKTPVGGGGVLLTDENGRLRVIANVEGVEEAATDFSGRQYYQWAREAQKGEVFYGNPIISKAGTSEGKFIIPVATPVIDDNGSFRGVLVVGALVEDLGECCLDSIRFVDSARVYLVKKDSTLIYGPEKDLVGEELISSIEENTFFGSEKALRLLRQSLEDVEKEGKIETIMPKNADGIFPVQRVLISHSPVVVGEQEWFLAMVVPRMEALSFIAPFVVRGAGVILFAFFALLLLTVKIARIKGHEEAKAG